ncbi:phytoene desaturase family protein [Terricaulis sp.]|uniref:phytoene desaturase family protein n=1 Tax=Terricaulis sp. TaxID=2768686 RepID=UPI003784D733
MADVIVIGAGLNGLVAANYLAKAGKRVLVLERRAIAGGQAATESFGAGFMADALHAGGQLRPDIVGDLDLARHGLPESKSEPLISLLPDGRQVRLSADSDDATLASIRALSAKDAERWPDFVAFMRQATTFLDAAYRTPMPRLPHVSISEGLPLAQLGLKLRGLGPRDMFRVIRMLPMSALELTEEWFEADAMRAAIGAVAVHGSTLGPMSAGSGYTLMHNWLNRGGPGHKRVEGGVGRIAEALVAALKARGGELRTSAEVKTILQDDQVVRGVTLASGEEIAASIVISGADPKHTLLDLVGAPELPPEFVWHTQSIKMRGSVAKVHLLTDGDHGLPNGTVVIAPAIRYVERAYDAAKYGQISQAPYLELTASGKVVSIHFQFAPYKLRDSEWSQERAVLERIALDTAAEALPQLRASIRETKSLTPLDLEQTYGLTEGDLNHGQLILDQMFFMRPMPGWSTHNTPIDNLYLCGAGVHGGGGLSGAAGRNAAAAVLKA